MEAETYNLGYNCVLKALMSIYSNILISTFLLLVGLLTGFSGAAQVQDEVRFNPDSLHILRMEVINGDTILYDELEAFVFIDNAKPLSARDKRRYGRLRKRVIKTYPYAKVTQALLVSYEEELEKLSSEKEKKDYMNLAEAELKAEFEGEIRNMTITEGKILMKLIDRETGETSFALIKKLKGGFTAFMYQSVARLFGSNLKSEYDAAGDDLLIEEIVSQIESGAIYVPPKQAVTTKAQERLDRKTRKLEKKRRRLEKKALDSVAKAG